MGRLALNSNDQNSQKDSSITDTSLIEMMLQIVSCFLKKVFENLKTPFYFWEITLHYMIINYKIFIYNLQSIRFIICYILI